MAVRTIRVIGDEILYKECKPVKEMTQRVEELIEDMFETMYENNGVGLAAPQVGILKQIVVIDVDDGNQYVLINPEIIEEEGSQTGQEGCLSVPGKAGIVTRPQKVKVKALDENMEDPYCEMPAGLTGIVDSVDDLGQIHCHWENGSSLALIPGVDHFHQDMTQEPVIESSEEQEPDLEL